MTIETATTTTTFEFTLTPETKVIKEFICFQPGYFYGVGDSEAAERWLLSHPRLHKLLRVKESI
ncbi:hypothetical protein Scep_010252 [Stephania cephalantha]|uniref:Uncharacterized protein n=1 Tax=Stephania cephalantha TaxID=152367 RepID=A0AAP0JUN6_9MAGN